MVELHENLRDDVRMLGESLGQTIESHLGEAFLQKIERIRQLAKAGRDSGEGEQNALLGELGALNEDEVLPVARAFSQFLNLANIAEEYDRVRHAREVCNIDSTESFAPLLKQLQSQGHNDDKILQTLTEMNVELVLTAHPTEANRRTLIQKYNAITDCLRKLEHGEPVQQRLNELVSQIWHTNEIRTQRPTPVDSRRAPQPENTLGRAHCPSLA